MTELLRRIELVSNHPIDDEAASEWLNALLAATNSLGIAVGVVMGAKDAERKAEAQASAGLS